MDMYTYGVPYGRFPFNECVCVHFYTFYCDKFPAWNMYLSLCLFQQYNLNVGNQVHGHILHSTGLSGRNPVLAVPIEEVLTGASGFESDPLYVICDFCPVCLAEGWTTNSNLEA